MLVAVADPTVPAAIAVEGFGTAAAWPFAAPRMIAPADVVIVAGGKQF